MIFSISGSKRASERLSDHRRSRSLWRYGSKQNGAYGLELPGLKRTQIFPFGYISAYFSIVTVLANKSLISASILFSPHPAALLCKVTLHCLGKSISAFNALVFQNTVARNCRSVGCTNSHRSIAALSCSSGARQRRISSSTNLDPSCLVREMIPGKREDAMKESGLAAQGSALRTCVKKVIFTSEKMNQRKDIRIL